MARLSIVIPCLRDSEPFENTLISVLQNRPPDCEVVVPHAGTYDDPYELNGDVRFVEARSDASLLNLVNLGWTQSTGEVVHVLECGVQVNEGWTEPILALFETPSIGLVAPLLKPRSGRTSRTVAGVRYGVFGRKLVYRASSAKPQFVPPILGPTLAAGFYRRTALEEVGGFDAIVGDRYGDIDIALALEAAGYDAICEPSSLVSAAHIDHRRLGFADARRSERLFWKHRSSEDGMGQILLHLLVVAAEFLFPLPGPRNVARLWGRLVGSLEPRINRGDGPPAVKHVGPPEPAYIAHRDARRRESSSDDRQRTRKRRRVVA